MLSLNSKFRSFLMGLIVACFAHAPGQAFADEKGECRLPGDGCNRISAIMKSWNSQPLAAYTISEAGSAAVIEGEQPAPEIDAANAAEKERAAQVGPCYYDGAEERIELTASALKLSDESLAECLAGALAQARYEEIEGRWLEQVGEREAWIVKGGEMRKVSAEQKLPPVAARSLWASFATRELVALHRAARSAPVDDASAAAGGRAIASVAGAGDAGIRALLGLAQ